jgi:beta-lactamase superfamily II metal-dependent hydrolase
LPHKLKFGPDSDEMEVSIFGPGKGEALAIHLGGGDWITVDSCRNQRSKAHALLDYFETIGVDPATSVKLVVGTHAHDDHIAGIADLFRACKSARLVTSQAFVSEEFFENIQIDEALGVQLRQRIREEYNALYEEIFTRGPRNGLIDLIPAQESMILWQRAATDDLPYAEVRALSPSAQATLRARRVIAEAVAKVGDKKAFQHPDPNEAAIALWVRVGDTHALLGADLTIGPNACGWKAVVASNNQANLASQFKVPHHGSPTADHEPVWSEMLTQDVVSVIAPFRGSGTSRPSPSDLERISSRSSAVYVTAKTKIPAASAHATATARSLSGVARNVRDVNGIPGHVRARALSVEGSPWTVETFSPGHKVSAA